MKAIAREISRAGIPSEVSHTAGTFVCNHVFYRALHAAAGLPSMRAGFVHVPWAAETAPEPDARLLPLADIARALEIAVRTSVRVTDDVAVSAGTLS